MAPKSADRHKEHSVQYNARVPVPLLAAFHAACAARNVRPSTMVRALMQGYVDMVAEETRIGS